MFLTVLYALLFYVAAVILVAGLVFKIYLYAKTPAPLKIATTPAPKTKLGVGLRLFREVAFFESLFRGSKWTWIFGYLFHFGMFLVLIRHSRYFIEPFFPLDTLVVQSVGRYAAFAMMAGLIGLMVRRIFVDRVRYISNPSDYLMLILIFMIAFTGALMSFTSLFHPDVYGVHEFFSEGILEFSFASKIPHDFIFIVHLTLVIVLMIIFPYSKLIHGIGVFFSPTRNQVDNPRERRHIVRWAKKLEK